MKDLLKLFNELGKRGRGEGEEEGEKGDPSNEFSLPIEGCMII